MIVIVRKCFNQLFTGEICANMNKKSSNLTAFCFNLFNKHTNPYEFMNCIACSCSSKNQFVPRDTIKVKTTASLTFLNVSHCQIIVLSTKCCWLSTQTGGNPRLSTTLTQRVVSPLLGELQKDGTKHVRRTHQAEREWAIWVAVQALRIFLQLCARL